MTPEQEIADLKARLATAKRDGMLEAAGIAEARAKAMAVERDRAERADAGSILSSHVAEARYIADAIRRAASLTGGEGAGETGRAGGRVGAPFSRS